MKFNVIANICILGIAMLFQNRVCQGQSSNNETLNQAFDWLEHIRFDSAEMAFNQILNNPQIDRQWSDQVQALVGMSMVDQALLRNDSAISHLQKAEEYCSLSTEVGRSYFGDIYRVYGRLYNDNFKQFDLAREYYLKALKAYSDDNKADSPNSFKAQIGIARVFINTSYYQRADSVLTKCLQQLKIRKGEDYSAIWFDCYLHMGKVKFYTGEPNECQKYYDLAIDKWQQMGADEFYPELESVYNGLGNLAYLYRADYNASVENYKKSLHIDEHNFGRESRQCASDYISLGVAYSALKDLDEAISYFKLAESVGWKIYPHDDFFFGRLYNNLGVNYQDFNMYEESLQSYRKALPIYEKIFGENHPYTYGLYQNIGSVMYQYHKDSAMNHEALKYFIKAKDIILQRYGTRHPVLVKTYNYLGLIYGQLGDRENALKYCILASDLIPLLPERDPFIPYVYLSYAFCYNQFDESGKAVEYLQKIFDFAHLDLSATNTSQWRSFYDKRLLINILKEHALAMQGLFNQEGNIHQIDIAIQDYKLVGEIYDQMVEVSRIESLKMINLPELVKSYHRAVDGCMKAYKASGDKKYVDEAFEYSERSKAILMLDNLKNISASKFANVPDSVINKENHLKEKIKFLEGKLTDQQFSITTDSSYQILQGEYFGAVRNLENFIREIENQYPAYYHLRYVPVRKDIAAIQAGLFQDSHDVLLEYVISKEQLHIFIVQKNEVQVISEDQDVNMAEEVFDLRKALMHSDFEGYRHLSNKLYAKLIDPVKAFLDKDSIQHITVVPDGWLHYLPFGILSRSSGNDNFATAPYLICKYHFDYHYSANLALQFRNKETKERISGVLAFAPAFSKNADNLFADNLSTSRDSLRALEGAKKELKNISRLFSGDYLTGKAASESNFKQLAGKYSIIHLATHALVEDNNPEFSRLMFGQDTLLGEDGKLYSYELYNLRLNAELVTLSACNTGTGKLQEGEGMMSLARGFMYAGCPSLVVSLWSVSDKSTAEVIKLFYEGLKRGLPKDEALQQAKKIYLSQADPLEANPIYWGGFVLVGNDSPLQEIPTGPLNWILIVSIAVGLSAGIFLILFFKNRHGNMNSR